MIRYGQFCPVAKTAEIFGDRWSPLIIRELCYGPRSFGDFLAALPLISRTMLSQRLKELAAADVVHADAKEKGRGYSYTLTAAGGRMGAQVGTGADWSRRSRFAAADMGNTPAHRSGRYYGAGICSVLQFQGRPQGQPHSAPLVDADPARRD